ELCSVLGVAPRTLRGAFAVIRHISPCRYLKRRRLIMVHRVLQSACQHRLLVKTVAFDHGFWHLGHFVHDYFALFGETPSDTASHAGWALVDGAGARSPAAAKPLRPRACPSSMMPPDAIESRRSATGS